MKVCEVAEAKRNHDPMLNVTRFDASAPPTVTSRFPESISTGKVPAETVTESPELVWTRFPAVANEMVWLNRVAFPGGVNVAAIAFELRVSDCQ